jgi:hypothetical protein
MAQVNAPAAARSLHRACALACALIAGSALAQDTSTLDAARSAAAAGRIGEGLRLLDRHLAAHPDDRAARIDRARFLAWRGDHAAALATLDGLGPDDIETALLRARIHAWAGRRNASLAINAPVRAAAPDNHDAQWNQALASRLGERPEQALPALAQVTATQPDSRDTRDLARAVRLPMFSSVGLPIHRYSDDDDIEIESVGLDASVRVSETWRLHAGGVQRTHRAPVGNPFAPVTGGDEIDEDRVAIGATASLSPSTAVTVHLVRSRLDPAGGDGTATLGSLALRHRATDDFAFGLRAERERVAASPRAISLGVLRNTVALDALWQPTLRDRIGLYGWFDDYSDGNRRRAVLADWRHAVVRHERGSVDLGLQGEWQGFSHDPGNGYYSPDRYTRIAPVASAYLPLGQDAGLYLQTSLGVQRDETFDRWKRAASVNAELTLGIHSRWQLVGRAAYSRQLNEFGQYEGRSVGLELRYRFCDHRRAECPAAAE